MAPREEIDPRILEGLPIFPLPNAVLLPGGLMPLHVFEPRYRELTRDCLAGARTLAIARLRPGYQDDYYGTPPICPYVGVGTIIASDELADGRYLIVLRGVARARVEAELPMLRTYREVRACLVGDIHRRPEVERMSHTQLVSLCNRLAEVLDRGGDQLRALCADAPDPGACADAVAAALIMDHHERQRLLEMIDPADRLERTTEYVARMLCQLAPCPGSALN